ncbi:uncharacterized protein METZ01_LOCUS154035 [marine metagenome]|jgi:hypothetical protein|uniref:EF-hand domain-containing protein n=1 Tax=marine metagenome TaxID=408172 RepID=A0A382AIR4_9ZZZZ|tara:strand:+ start:588 stop:1247 length:660 start_codon:yes stop_codon:yes gene_type:complete
MNRLDELKAHYRYKKGDKPVSKWFQRIYNIIVPLIFCAILGIMIYLCLWAILFFLPPKYPLAATIFLTSIVAILLIRNAFFNESWKNSILVKNANGSYEFRFRKKSAIEAKRKKMMKKMITKIVDRDGDGKVTFEEILRFVGEEITKEEEEKLRLKFERLDVDKDEFVNAEDALRAFDQDTIICKVCSKEFEPEMGTKEFDYEICGKTEDCKNKLWKLK